MPGEIDALIPPPEELAAVIFSFAQGPWPGTGVERRRVFERLGFTDLPRSNESFPGTWHASTPLPAVSMVWSEQDGTFVGFDFFAYASAQPASETTTTAYESLRQIFCAAYDSPVEEWGTGTAPAAEWRIHDSLHLTMYCHSRRDSVVQVGVEDSTIRQAKPVE